MGLQHTPVVSERDETSIMSHNLLSELLKKFSLQWLGKIIGNHLFRGQVLNHDIALLHLVCNKEITNVNCTGPLARDLLTVVFQQNSALVVLIKNVLRDFVALGLQKQLGLKDTVGVEQSSTPTNSASVLLRVLSFCFEDLVMGNPRP